METRQIHVRDLSTVTGIQQFEHEVQSIYFLGLEDFVGTIYLSIESDDYSNEAIPLTSNTFIIGQPMTLYNVTYTCQIYGVLNDGEKIQLSKRFRLIVDKSNDIQGESSEYPIDPNFENSIVEFVNEQKAEIDTYTDAQKSEIEATGEAVFASIPSDYSTLEQATYNAYPTQSETGNPIYIDDGADDIPVKELIVSLEPKQSGSGDPSPSNVRAISGYDGVTVKRTGKNLLPNFIESDVSKHGLTLTLNGNGTISINGTPTSSTNSRNLNRRSFSEGELPLKKGTYTFNTSNTEQLIYANVVLWNGVEIYTRTGSATRTIEADTSIRFLDIGINPTDGNAINTTLKPQLELGSTATEYEPYKGQEYSITFPSNVGTVYGGTLNVTTGLLTVDRKGVDLGTLSWRERISGTGQWLASSPSGSIAIQGVTSPLCISDRYVRNSKTNTLPSNGEFIFNASSLSASAKYLFITDTSYSSDTEFKNGVTGSIFVYPLDGKLTYQLTPTEVSTLLGSNTISSDGSMDLEYRADTTKVIEKLTNAIISLGGNI